MPGQRMNEVSMGRVAPLNVSEQIGGNRWEELVTEWARARRGGNSPFYEPISSTRHLLICYCNLLAFVICSYLLLP